MLDKYKFLLILIIFFACNSKPKLLIDSRDIESMTIKEFQTALLYEVKDKKGIDDFFQKYVDECKTEPAIFGGKYIVAFTINGDKENFVVEENRIRYKSRTYLCKKNVSSHIQNHIIER